MTERASAPRSFRIEVPPNPMESGPNRCRSNTTRLQGSDSANLHLGKTPRTAPRLRKRLTAAGSPADTTVHQMQATNRGHPRSVAELNLVVQSTLLADTKQRHLRATNRDPSVHCPPILPVIAIEVIRPRRRTSAPGASGASHAGLPGANSLRVLMHCNKPSVRFLRKPLTFPYWHPYTGS